MSHVARVTLLTQDDCAFCDHAKTVLARVSGEHPLEIQEIRLDSAEGRALAIQHAVLFAPGVLLNGALFSHGRLSEKKLRRTLERLPSPSGSDQYRPTGQAK
ncbi:glutaredoxin [Kribbella aluminosa]|uniref:Glutaredoxin n=1 Tax=Kribbella aluminosa TaxID=416017 RepID=A0ABS4UBH1_9ACTN|nr:glutaredoxin family protein [Kribbella aluminosa]MBP2348981.1 glutaredoxin [Kribbella aluminosa]